MRDDGAHDRGEVSTHTAAVVVEDRRDGADIRRAGIRRHQLLNQLAADEWPDVGMIEEQIERLIEILASRLSRWKVLTEKPLRASIVK